VAARPARGMVLLQLLTVPIPARSGRGVPSITGGGECFEFQSWLRRERSADHLAVFVRKTPAGGCVGTPVALVQGSNGGCPHSAHQVRRRPRMLGSIASIAVPSSGQHLTPVGVDSPDRSGGHWPNAPGSSRDDERLLLQGCLGCSPPRSLEQQQTEGGGDPANNTSTCDRASRQGRVTVFDAPIASAKVGQLVLSLWHRPAARRQTEDRTRPYSREAPSHHSSSHRVRAPADHLSAGGRLRLAAKILRAQIRTNRSGNDGC